MFRNKKGSEMSMNIIIIAAIALLILVVVTVLVLNAADDTNTATTCVGGDCVPEGNCDGTSSKIGCQEGYVCCRELFSDDNS